MEVLFAKAFLSTPGSTRGFVKPKGSKNKMGAEKSAPILQNEGKRREKMKK